MLRETFYAHPSMQHWKDCLVIIDELSSSHDEYRSYISVFDKAKYFDWSISQSDEGLFTERDMQLLQSNVDNVFGVLTTMRHDFSGNINNLDAYISTLIGIVPYPRVKRIYRSETNDIIQSFREELGSFKTSVDENRTKYNATIEEQFEKMQSLSVETDNIEKKSSTSKGN